MNEQIVNSMIQSVVRAGLVAAAGAMALKVQTHDLDTTVGVVSAILLTLVSLGWSAFTHKKNINSPPPPPSAGGSGLLGLLLAVTLGGIMAAGTVSMQGCKGGGITAAQLAEYREQADKAEADLQAEIQAARAEGNTAAADKAQAILDKFHEERAKFETHIKTDANGDVDVESSIASAAMIAAPPGVSAGILVLLALVKRWRAGQATPPSIPPTA